VRKRRRRIHSGAEPFQSGECDYILRFSSCSAPKGSYPPFFPLQVEIDKQSAVIRDLNDKVKRANAAPRLTQDAGKLKQLIDRNLELERQVEELRGSLARQQQPVAPASAGASSGDKDEALLKKVTRQSQSCAEHCD